MITADIARMMVPHPSTLFFSLEHVESQIRRIATNGHSEMIILDGNLREGVYQELLDSNFEVTQSATLLYWTVSWEEKENE